MSLVRGKPQSRHSAREHRLRQGFENAPIGIAFATIGGRWLQVNEYLRAMLGYSREELSRFDVDSMTHEDDAANEAPMKRRLLHDNTDSYRIKKRMLHVSGTYRSVLVHASLVRNSVGEPDFFVYFIEEDDQAPQWRPLDNDVIAVLRDIAGDRRSGALTMLSGERQHDFFFDRGRIFSSASNDPNFFLTEHLIASGIITEEQRERALEVKQITQLALGRILVIMGVVTEEQLVRAMRLKVEGELAQLLECNDARWAFVDGDVPKHKLVPLGIDVEDLIAPPNA